MSDGYFIPVLRTKLLHLIRPSPATTTKVQTFEAKVLIGDDDAAYPTED